MLRPIIISPIRHLETDAHVPNLFQLKRQLRPNLGHCPMSGFRQLSHDNAMSLFWPVAEVQHLEIYTSSYAKKDIQARGHAANANGQMKLHTASCRRVKWDADRLTDFHID
jgi:hypothetical protein